MFLPVLGKYLGMELPGPRVNVYLVLKEIAGEFSPKYLSHSNSHQQYTRVSVALPFLTSFGVIRTFF